MPLEGTGWSCVPFFCVCRYRSQHPRSPGGGPPRPSAHAFRQHAAGGGRGGTRERWRICRRRSCSSSLGRGGRQLHRTFRLQSQTHPDQTDLPHRAGEIRAGEEGYQKCRGWNFSTCICLHPTTGESHSFFLDCAVNMWLPAFFL